VAKPLTTRFVKRQPRLTKPLELKKRPRPRQRQIERRMVAVKARLQRDQGAVMLEPTHVLRGLARPRPDITRVGGPGGAGTEPTAAAEIIEGIKDPEQRIDTSLELLDIEALDTGKYHALVIQDPEDKKSVKGYCRLGIVYSPTIHAPIIPPGNPGIVYFEPYFLPGFVRLARAVNQYTDIRTEASGGLELHDAEILKAPWLLFLGMWRGFALSPGELENLGKF